MSLLVCRSFRLLELFVVVTSLVTVLGSLAPSESKNGPIPKKIIPKVDKLTGSDERFPAKGSVTSAPTMNSLETPNDFLTDLEREDDILNVLRQSTFDKREGIPSLSEHQIQRVFCNFNYQSADRKGDAKFTLDNTDASYCTDFNYDSAEIEDYHLKYVPTVNLLPHRSNLFLPRYTALNDMKVTFRNLRTFLTLTESMDSQRNSFTFLVHNSSRNRDFVTACAYNLRLWGFDGLFVKWLFPEEPSMLTKLLLDLKTAFETDFQKQKKGLPRLLLGVILSGETGAADDLYEVYAISNLVDIITLQVFDEFPSLNDTTKTTCTLFSRNTAASQISSRVKIGEENTDVYSPKDDNNDIDEYAEKSRRDNLRRQASTSHPSTAPVGVSGEGDEKVRDYIIEETIKEWSAMGADTSKIVIALTLIGQGYVLKNKANNGIGALVSGRIKNAASGIPGQVLFYEMCKLTKEGGTVNRVSNLDKTPYWYNGTTWISYEDIVSISQKIDYLKNSNVLGVMIHSQSEDDFTGSNCEMGAFPVTKATYNVSELYFSSLKRGEKYHWVTYCVNEATLPAITSFWLTILAAPATYAYAF